MVTDTKKGGNDRNWGEDAQEVLSKLGQQFTVFQQQLAHIIL